MRRVRILHVLSLNIVGGVERLFDAWLAHPAAGDFEHHVLSMRRDVHPRFAGTLHARAASVSFANHWCGLRLPRRPAALRAGRVGAALDRVRPNLILLWNALGDAELMDLLRRSGSRLGYYEHGAAWMRRADDPDTAALPRMDAVLCACHASKRLVELRFGVKSEAVHVIPNPVIGLAASAPAGTEAAAPDRPLRVGFAGRITPLKGLPLLLHAARRMIDAGTECAVRVAGTGADLAAMKQLAASLRLSDNVTFLGSVADMPAFYRDIDILVAPSLRETMPLVCMEAAWAGRPVIASAINGTPEVVLDGRTGFTLPPRLPLTAYAEFGGTSLRNVAGECYDAASDSLKPAGLVSPDDIAERLLRLHNDCREYAAMSSAAALRAREVFGMDRYAEAMGRAMNDLAAATEPPSARASWSAPGAPAAVPQA